MFKLCKTAMDLANKQKVEFADIRIIREREQNLGIDTGVLSTSDNSLSFGFGVRVLYNGAWGFASSSEVTESEIKRITQQAILIAKASAMLKDKPVKFAHEEAYKDYWQSPVLIDPFQVPLDEKLGLLFEIDKELRKDAKIKSTYSTLRFINKHQFYANTQGSEIEQVFTVSGTWYRATAVNNNDVQSRSYPSSHGGQILQSGYEVIESADLLNNAPRVREEAIALLSAPQCPVGKMDLIIGGNQLALQIHESVGHASELDRVLGYEESYAGSSFATTEKLNKFRYGSPIVNLVADNTLPMGLATGGYDDDGVKAQRWHIVKDGVLTGYMTNREFCHTIGHKRSKGSCRADSFANIPITRISNLGLMPGKWDYDDLIKDTQNGIIMDNNTSWSIDQRRVNFQFGAEIGRIIKNGKITGIVKNPVYQGITPEFWGSCDAICNDKYWGLHGVANCGKGQPAQISMMCHASSPARFRKVNVGIKK